MISVREEQCHSTFYCNQADYDALRHIPNAKGYLSGKKVKNGDYLIIIDNDNSYCYDEEGKEWIKKKLILSDGGTGGTGTDDYDDLLNKPSINGVVLRNNKTLKDLGIINYNDTQVKSDITDLKSDKQDKTDNTLETTDKTVVGAINEVNGNQLDTVGFSADYKNIIINRKSGLNPYTIPISAIIHNAKLTELNDVDSTNIGDGKTLVYDSATQKHKYVDSTGTDELVKMDSTTDAKHLSELIDKSTIVNDNGVLKVKKLDGQEVTIAEINHLKGLTMNVMDLVNTFANGGVKVYEQTIPTHADLLALDRSKFIDGIKYFVYVLADETHGGAKTTYICDKSSTSYFCVSGDHRDFTTSPIDLANEVTGKLGTANIDVNALWKLLTINDTYKTLTTKNEPFGTHGAKALYDELVASIGKKANATDLTSHTGDTNIHITTSERTKWNNVDNKVNKTDIIDNLTSTNTDKPLSANQGKVLKGEVDLKANKTEVVKKTDITTTINSTSTDSQVPSAKSVWDNIKKNGLIWQGKQELQNSQESTVFNYCKSNFIAERICGFRLEPKDGSGYFSSASVTIIYCLSSVNYGWILGISDKSGIPMAIIQKADNITKWQRLCTTSSVADVPKTDITSNNTDLYTIGQAYYCVKNGICYINFWPITVKKTGGSIKTGKIFPHPLLVRASGTLIDGNGNFGGQAYIGENGELRFDCILANTGLYCTISYPVENS